jgi:hypothetical protein
MHIGFKCQKLKNQNLKVVADFICRVIPLAPALSVWAKKKEKEKDREIG